jgi:hypothetical protein
MKTSTLPRVGLIGGLTLAAGVTVGVEGCGRTSGAGFGNIEVLATVPDDVSVDQLSFKISDLGAVVATGHVRAPRPQEEFSDLVKDVPVGDYDVDVDAPSTDGKLDCEGSASLEVRKGLTTRIHVALACHVVGDGIVQIKIGVVCASTHLVSYAISPLSASVGATIDVAAIDEDPDAGALTYAWSATTGTFADPAAATTTYRCTAAGGIEMTLVATSNGCQETHTIAVTCVKGGGADAGRD